MTRDEWELFVQIANYRDEVDNGGSSYVVCQCNMLLHKSEALRKLDPNGFSSFAVISFDLDDEGVS